MSLQIGRQAAIGDETRRGGLAILTLAALAGWLIYATIFRLTLSFDLADAALAGATNVAPLVILALAFGLAVRVYLMPLSVRRQALCHMVFAPAFAACWYGAIVVLQALVRLACGEPLALIGFSGAVLAWQCFQGLVLYAAVAASSYALARDRRGGEAETAPPLERYLAKSGEAIQRVDVRDIVSISGAQDYSEVSTLGGRHLARFSLGEFERRLDPARFLRIHRSIIVNLDFLDRAEPAGNGRFLIVMTNGEAVQTSRNGAKRLRALVC